eukprot:2281011-Ditylum_brightwellii.AAC.1
MSTFTPSLLGILMLVQKGLEATVCGKQTRVHQNIQSTQILHEDIDDPDTCNDAYPAQTSEKENVVVLSITDPRQLKH